MYSVVLAMALAGGAEATECHWGLCGCTGSSWSGCYGSCYGGCWGGCYGGCCGSVYYGTGGMPYVRPAPEKVGEPKKDQVLAPTPATILVNLPPNAKLTIDKYVSRQTSTQRVLLTPPIEPQQEFTYTFLMEANQNGLPVSQSRQVTVRPGQQMFVNFRFDATPVTASR